MPAQDNGPASQYADLPGQDLGPDGGLSTDDIGYDEDRDQDRYRDERDYDDYRDDYDDDRYYDDRRRDDYDDYDDYRDDRRRRDRPMPKKGKGGRNAPPRKPVDYSRSSSVGSIAGQMKKEKELGSTLAAIGLSAVDFSLHVATAIFCQVDRPLPHHHHPTTTTPPPPLPAPPAPAPSPCCQVEYYGEHSLFWAFITLAVFANMLAIVGHVVRSANRRQPGDDDSDLERKFKERPEECVVVMMLGGPAGGSGPPPRRRTAPHPPPRSVGRLGGAPAHAGCLRSLGACGGLSSPPPATPRLRTAPPSTASRHGQH